jgi:hypothetical protein
MLFSMQDLSVQILDLHFLDPETALNDLSLLVVVLNIEQKPKHILIY